MKIFCCVPFVDWLVRNDMNNPISIRNISSDGSLDVKNGILFGEGIVVTSVILKITIPIPGSEPATVVPVQATRPACLQVIRCCDQAQVVVLVTIVCIENSKVRVCKESFPEFIPELMIQYPNVFIKCYFKPTANISVETMCTFLATVSLEPLSAIVTSVSLVTISTVASGVIHNMFTCGAMETEPCILCTFIVIYIKI